MSESLAYLLERYSCQAGQFILTPDEVPQTNGWRLGTRLACQNFKHPQISTEQKTFLTRYVVRLRTTQQ